MATFELACFAQSGNAYKAALMLALHGADWQPRFVDFFNGGARAPEFLADNALGEVPVLHHGDVVVSQSAVILDYLSHHFDSYRIDTDDKVRREGLRWLFWDNHKLTAYTALHRFLTQFAPSADEAVVAFMKGRRDIALKVLERHLAGRDWMVDARPTIVDLSLCGYLYWPEEIGVDISATFPAIARWLDRISALDGWKHPYDLMPGHPLPDRA
ncbi:MAG: glutathione S-transferase family protein [Pseudomonadota bacterium]